MHLTEIVLLDGTVIRGTIVRQRYDPEIFERSYIKIYGRPAYTIAQLRSATTEGERVSINAVVDVDEMVRMRKLWDDYREGRLRGLPLIGGKEELSEM